MLENNLNHLKPLQGRVQVRGEREGQVRPRRQAAEHPHPLVDASYRVILIDMIYYVEEHYSLTVLLHLFYL